MHELEGKISRSQIPAENSGINEKSACFDVADLAILAAKLQSSRQKWLGGLSADGVE